MTTSKQHIHILLLVLLCSYYFTDVAAKHNITVSCLSDQASSLLHLKRSFFIDVDRNLASWRAGRDCCHWKGVICDMASGRVVSLDLGGFNLGSRYLDPALFNLTSLRNLSLAFNAFDGAYFPSYGFERLRDIIHINFSSTQFSGQIPIEIARLKNIVTLDFSNNYGLYLQEPNFQTFMANLSNLRELRLDSVDIFSGGSTWSIVLAADVPQLQILSLAYTGISGPIHPSFSRLRSLTTINIRSNLGLTGKVPEFIAEFYSLSTLDISGGSFEGEFPTKIFQIKSLRTLDLAGNPNLSVCLPEFPVGNSLVTLNLAGITLTCDIPPSIVNLGSLKTLSMSTTGIFKGGPLISKLPSLNYLQLSGDLGKPILSWIGNIKQLSSLVLMDYDFSQSGPSWIGNLTTLESLVFMFCNFHGPIPYWVGNHANLARLHFMDCNSSGPIPPWIGNLTKLTELRVKWCNFSDSIPPWIGNLTKLIELDVYECNFSGPIPSEMGNLAQLEYLSLSSNNLSGAIPKSLIALPALQELWLYSNQLSGPLEDITAPLSSPLRTICLETNQLSGPIPKSLFQFKHLQFLMLDSNRLSGTVELSSFWRLKSLYWLSLSNNMLSVVDEEGDDVLPFVSNIEHLLLASCNLTKLPAVLRYLDKLSELDISSNQIKGVIPSWIWENWKDHLRSLDLSNNMFTTLEKSPSLVHMPYLTFLNLSFNRLQGIIPIPVTSDISTAYFIHDGAALDYSNNSFSSIVPNFGGYIRNTAYLDLSKNRLNGYVPSSICRASKLRIMDLSYNNFTGSVPSCLIESGNLNILKLRENQLKGMLPENITEGCKFQTIDLNGNQFEGKLPRSLSNCQDLELLDIGNNQFVDYFPYWLGILPKLRVLVLRSNQFGGTIRDIKGHHRISNHFISLQILDLASNIFSGNLPKGWLNELDAMIADVNDEGQAIGNQTNFPNGFYRDIIIITFKGSGLSFSKILTTFKAIDFSNNSFNGTIPESIGRLVSLHGLNMSYNNFTGQIPSQFSNLSQLESLDLCCNQLSGEIPQELTSLTYLEWFNISYNNLTGRIPLGNQFSAFPNSSFEGNVDLCGIPLSKQCDNQGSIVPTAAAPPESNSLWQDKFGVILLFAFVGLGFGVGFALSFLLRLFCHKE